MKDDPGSGSRGTLETSLENVERVLRETNTFLQNILESSSAVSIISTDLGGNILYWNIGAENIFGYMSEEVVGREKISILYPEDEEETKALVEAARSVLTREKKGAVCEVREVTKDGRKLWIHMTLTPRLDPKGSVVGILGIGEDVTERKRAEADLQQTLKKVQKTLEGVIRAMMVAVESRDPYTAGHQRVVADLACAIAKEMDLPPEQIEGLRMAGFIHDLGKIAVPAEILSKPGELSSIQFSMIKTHPEVGHEIIKSIEFPWPIAEIVLQHHERIDGSGYPAGLEGEEILLEARIIAVADVVEAMASHRPYRPGLGIEMALGEIQANRGAIYDPAVVDVCVELFREKGYQLQP